MTLFSKRSEAGIAHLAILVVAICVIGVALLVFLFIRAKNNASNESETYSSDSSSSFQISHRNTARKNDVTQLLGATAEYINNNSGQLPTTYEEGVLKGGTPGTNNVAPRFEILKYVTFAKGQQPAVTGLYDMRFVAGAVCGENGETKEASSSRSYAVQSARENVNGGYTSTCQEG